MLRMLRCANLCLNKYDTTPAKSVYNNSNYSVKGKVNETEFIVNNIGKKNMTILYCFDHDDVCIT